jgi:hypothetical protein
MLNVVNWSWSFLIRKSNAAIVAQTVLSEGGSNGQTANSSKLDSLSLELHKLGRGYELIPLATTNSK